jgi:hypothetical protein
MNIAEDFQHSNSQKDLAAGVLKQATQDLRRFYRATSPIERELYFDAYNWLKSENSSWPFSFVNVCRLLNLTPETVRRDVLDDISLDKISLWTKRCRRVARRFQNAVSRAFTSGTRSNPKRGTLAHALR